jgi:hypothetical protein
MSNVFYPERALKARLGPVAPVALYSPVSMAVTTYRYCFGYSREVDLVFNTTGLLVWSVSTVLLAYKLYIRNLQK